MRCGGRLSSVVRDRAYRRWLLLRHGSAISIDPSATISGRIELARGARLVVGPLARVEDLFQVWGSVTVEVGRSSTIFMGVRIYGTGSVVFGDRVVVNGTKINCLESVLVGDDSLIGSAFITDTDFHNVSPTTRRTRPAPDVTEAVSIGSNVWIGYGCIVLKGCRIGDDSVLGAGSVLRGNVADGVVVAGNPAVVVRTFPPSERT